MNPYSANLSLFYYDQNDGYEINMNSYQVRKINNMKSQFSVFSCGQPSSALSSKLKCFQICVLPWTIYHACVISSIIIFLVGCQISANFSPLDLAVKYVAKVNWYVKKLEKLKNPSCHCEKRLPMVKYLWCFIDKHRSGESKHLVPPPTHPTHSSLITQHRI